MRTFFILLALAASTMAMASMQAVDTQTRPVSALQSPEIRACKSLVQKMERSPDQNTWHNRMRTWKCRDDLSPDTPETTALLREIGQ